MSKKHAILHKLIESKRQAALIGLFGAAAVILSAINYSVTGTAYDMCGSSYGIFPLTVSAAILLSAAVIMLSAHIHARWLASLGRDSMTYFAFHQSIGISIGKVIVDHLPNSPTICLVIQKILLFSIAMAICFVMDKIIRSTKLRFMVGA